MYQTIYETSTYQEFSPFALKPATAEMDTAKFVLEELLPKVATYRNGERYVCFELNRDELSVRIGVGSHRGQEATFNSIRLDDLVNFQYGRLPKGCHSVDDDGLQDCVGKAMKDLKEFAYEFLHGDFRPFLRTLAMYHREQRAVKAEAVDLSKQFYLA